MCGRAKPFVSRCAFGVVLVYIAALAIYHHFMIPAGREVLGQPDPAAALWAHGVFSLRKRSVWGSLIVMIVPL
jgi:hypothetical protein